MQVPHCAAVIEIGYSVSLLILSANGIVGRVRTEAKWLRREQRQHHNLERALDLSTTPKRTHRFYIRVYLARTDTMRRGGWHFQLIPMLYLCDTGPLARDTLVIPARYSGVVSLSMLLATTARETMRERRCAGECVAIGERAMAVSHCSVALCMRL